MSAVISKGITTKNTNDVVRIENKRKLNGLARNKSKVFSQVMFGHSVKMTSIKGLHKDRLEFSERSISSCLYAYRAVCIY